LNERKARTFFFFLKNYFFYFVEMAIFGYVNETENKYLQKVNLEALQKETGLDMKGLADLAEIGHKVVYKWAYLHKDSSRPDYNAIVRLLQKGATVETLFGVDYAAIHNLVPANQPAVPSEIARDSEFQEGLQAAMDAKIEAKVDAKVKAVVADMLREYGIPPRNGSV
jgi:hypothetical protein